MMSIDFGQFFAPAPSNPVNGGVDSTNGNIMIFGKFPTSLKVGRHIFMNGIK